MYYICQSDSLCFCSEVAGPSSFNCVFLVCLTLHVYTHVHVPLMVTLCLNMQLHNVMIILLPVL